MYSYIIMRQDNHRIKSQLIEVHPFYRTGDELYLAGNWWTVIGQNF